MKYYRCGCCGHKFTEEDTGEREEHEEFWGAIVPIYYSVCPECDEDISDEDEITEEEYEEEEG